MPYLKVLKLDHNPLDWPPKEITTFPLAPLATNVNARQTGSTDSERERRGTPGSKVEDAEEMQRWLPNLISWIKENSGKSSVPRISISWGCTNEHPPRQIFDLAPRNHLAMRKAQLTLPSLE